jgi:membrane protein YfhO
VLAIGWLSRHQTILAVLILVLVLHVCFLPFIWGNRTLLLSARGVPSVMPNGAWYGDPQGPDIYRGNDVGGSAWQLETYAPLAGRQYLRERHLPLWNPYQAFGTPLAANMHSQPFYPLFLPFALDPGPRTWNYFVLAHFLIAGLGAYLYLRLFLMFVPSIGGAIVFMLSGYFILFFNMPHLSVEILVPALFFATERLLHQKSIRNVALVMSVVFLAIVGGMPESTLLVLAFGSAYFLFRLFSESEIRTSAVRNAAYFIFSTGLGVALAAFLLLPFIEFLHFSFDTHQIKNVGSIPGLEHDNPGISIFTYVLPMLFGTAWHPVAPALGGYEALRGFFGILPLLLAIVAVGGLWAKPRHRRLIGFFLASVVVLLLKRYGAPVVNWTGHLPLFQLVLFPKYEEPLLAFAVASLAAFGLDQILAGAVSRRRLAVSLAIALALLASIAALALPAVAAVKGSPQQSYLSLVGTAAVLSIAAFLLMRPRRGLPGLLVALLICEMSGDYIYPVYYFMTSSATVGTNPYRGAPYIEFLQAHTTGNERIFGRDFILFPNWAGVFQLFDIRDLDAIFYWKYLRLVRRFLGDEVPHGPRGDGVNRFTGHLEHTFDTPLKKRLLQLSSVRYLLSIRPFAADSPVIQDVMDQNKGRLAAGRENLIETRQFTIGGASKRVLYEHPPYDRLPFATRVTPSRRQFLFSIAMDPAVYDGSHPICGAGVEFRLEVRGSDGPIVPLYDRYIDPKHDPAERRWLEGSVDLTKYLGQNVTLFFTTAPGPARDTCMGWAGWGDLHFSQEPAGHTAFGLVYDREIKIYEYPNVLPRAALFSSAELASDDSAALARLGSPALDLFTTAVVTAQGMDATNVAAIAKLNQLPADRVRAAQILSYSSQEVKIDALADRSALLVLNDSDYPGWNVYVDGRRSHWITANYMFRGVLLEPGRHLVRFAYEPQSFATGAAISAAALLCWAGFVVWRRRTARSGVAETHLVH